MLSSWITWFRVKNKRIIIKYHLAYYNMLINRIKNIYTHTFTIKLLSNIPDTKYSL